MSETKMSARQEMNGIVDGLRAELDSIYQTLAPEAYAKVHGLNKQMNDVSNEIYEIRRDMPKGGFTPEASTVLAILAEKFFNLYWERSPFLDSLEHEMWMHRAGVEEQLRQKEEYLIVASDEAMERTRAWERSPERLKCGLLTGDIPPYPTRFESGLAKPPCIYARCPDFETCHATAGGGREPVNVEYGLYPEEVKK